MRRKRCDQCQSALLEAFVKRQKQSGHYFIVGLFYRVPQSLAKLTVNFQSSLSICDSASEVANSTGSAGDSCNLQQYCDTGCQTDIMGEVGGAAAAPIPLEDRGPPLSHVSLQCLFVSPVFQYGPQDSSHLLDKVKVNWQYEEAKKK